MAAVLGGTQSLHTNALDEALALPTDFSARIARNTQIYSCRRRPGRRVVDPLGRQRIYVERLTYDLAEKAGSLIDEIEAIGGMAQGDRGGAAEAAHRGGGRAYAGEDAAAAGVIDPGAEGR
jgi:methylmalonyl-CoA mutase